MPHYFISIEEPQSLFEILLLSFIPPSKPTNSVSVRKWLIVFCNNPRYLPWAKQNKMLVSGFIAQFYMGRSV